MTKGLSNLNLSSKVKSYNAIFGEVNADTDIKMIPISLLKPFPNHPFKLYTGDRLSKLVESIKELGVLNPILVRKDGEEYQNLSGHNRTNASEMAGLKVVPCIIKDVDDDTAAIIVVDSNLRQRDTLLPSEKAFAYKMKMEALNRQGKRDRDTEVMKKSRELVGEELGDSGSQVQRYIRLTYLISPILDLVDDNKIPLNASVELSYLSSEEQELLHQFISKSEDNFKIKLSQAAELKNMSKISKATVSDIAKVFHLSTNLEKNVYMKLPKTNFTKYFKDNDNDEQILKVIINALDLYFNNL